MLSWREPDDPREAEEAEGLVGFGLIPVNPPQNGNNGTGECPKDKEEEKPIN